MGSLTPEHYKITKDMAEKYVKEVDDYLSEIHPIIILDDIEKRIKDGNKIIGRIELMIEALNGDSTRQEIWEERKKSMENIVTNLVLEYRKLISN